MKENSFYHSYLLRLWQVSTDNNPVWRASLQNIHTGVHLGFTDLETLFAYLKCETGVRGKGIENPGNAETGL